MKELFQLLSKYNTQTNVQMMGILEKLSTEQITAPLTPFLYPFSSLLPGNYIYTHLPSVQ
jgi:hypothetical protein